MKTYRILFKEELIHSFYIDAENEEAAREEFERMGMDGELDFSGGEVVDSGIIEVKEE